MTDWERARTLLAGGGYTAVLCRGSETFTTTARGVAPLLDWLDAQADMTGCAAADRVVGKAAAMLYVLLGVRAVYAPVMSEAAQRVLQQNGIEAACDTCVGAIRNRADTGLCPMEEAVAAIEEPQQARAACAAKRCALQEKNKAGTV